MRTTLLGLVAGAALIAASAWPALADCAWHKQVNASNDQYQTQQTAQADTQASDTSAQQ